MDSDFDSVSWQNEEDSEISRPHGAHPSHRSSSTSKRKDRGGPEQAGQYADDVDLAGVGGGRLDCNVDSPLKENDGTKDSYVSYLVTTHVRPKPSGCPMSLQQCFANC